MRGILAAVFVTFLVGGAHAGPIVGGSVTPSMPKQGDTMVVVEASVSNQAFQSWVEKFQRRARGMGIRATVLTEAFQGVRYNADVVRKDRNQSEFTKQIWDYLDTAVSSTRVRNGKRAMSKHIRTLKAIEAQYGVEAEVVAAVWGLESAYGTFRGKENVIEALATLAFDGRRGRFFERQLIAALRILQSGDVAPRKMTGSWAGAMGHTQFIPTSYQSFAQDHDGDGRRDIWSDDPGDALASTAHYLKQHGWTKDQPWGVEVTVPKGFDYAQAGVRIKKSPAQWARLGVRDVKGGKVANHGRASILLPAGARGAAFMIFDNFHVIERYNTADAYVIGVGHLSDRLVGGPKLKSGWPRDDRNPAFREKQEMQRLLTSRGFTTSGVDGIIGPNTISAIRRFQTSVGMVPDGYASFEILKRLR